MWTRNESACQPPCCSRAPNPANQLRSGPKPETPHHGSGGPIRPGGGCQLEKGGIERGGRVGPALSRFSQETPEETVQPGKIKLEESKVIQANSGS